LYQRASLFTGKSLSPRMVSSLSRRRSAKRKFIRSDNRRILLFAQRQVDAGDSKVDFMLGVEDTDFCLFSRGLPLVGFSLQKIRGTQIRFSRMLSSVTNLYRRRISRDLHPPMFRAGVVWRSKAVCSLLIAAKIRGHPEVSCVRHTFGSLPNAAALGRRRQPERCSGEGVLARFFR
jgi:hypothetical protein